MAQENVEIVRGLLAAIADERFDDVAPTLHPEVEIVPATDFPESETLRGLAGFRRWGSRFPAMFADYEFTVTGFWDAGDQVVVALHDRLRLVPGGAPIETHFAHLWTIRDGVVVRIEVFNASDEALEAAGLSESRLGRDPHELGRAPNAWIQLARDSRAQRGEGDEADE